jgi:hypothetical protein
VARPAILIGLTKLPREHEQVKHTGMTNKKSLQGGDIPRSAGLVRAPTILCRPVDALGLSKSDYFATRASLENK